MSVTVLSYNGARVSKATLAAAVASNDAVGKTIIVSGPISITNVTVPSTIALRIEGAGLITVGGGSTLTINGPFSAETRQVFAGTGSVVIAGAGYSNPLWWGAVTDATLQKAITAIASIGGTVEVNSDTCVIDAKVVVSSSIKLEFSPGCAITTTKTGSNVPLAFLECNGSDITISGARATYTKANFPTTTVGRFINLKAGSSNITVENCDINGCWSAVHGGEAGTLNDIVITDNRFSCIYTDIYLEGPYGRNLTIRNNHLYGDKMWTSPIQRYADIFIMGGYVFGQTFYPSNYANPWNTVVIENNTIDYPNQRAVNLTNAVNVAVRGNIVTGRDHTGEATVPYNILGYSHDCISLELCRGFDVSHNRVCWSGENGIDLLGCQNGAINHNVLTGISTVGIMISYPDIRQLGYTTTGGLSDLLCLCDGITGSGNMIAASTASINITSGRNINLAGTFFKSFWNHRVNYYLHLAFDADVLSDTWPIENVSVTGNTTSGAFNLPVTVNVDDTLTSAAAHGFETLDRVEIRATTVPGGLSATADYYVIKISDTVIKLASSEANAALGTAVNITSAGTSCYVSKVRGGTIYRSALSKVRWGSITLDENLAVTSPWQSVSANSEASYAHSAGYWHNVGIYGLIEDPGDYFSSLANCPSKELRFDPTYIMDITTASPLAVEKRGISIVWKDIYQLIYMTGAKLYPVLARSDGDGKGLATITSGYFRFRMW